MSGTKRVYRDDDAAYRCTSTVTAIADGALILDRTVFSPPTRSCPGDAGTIGGRRVTAVETDGELMRYRVSSTHWLCPGHIVSIEIDAVRRQRLAAHHTLSYLLRAFALGRWDRDAEAVSISRTYVTVELPAPRINVEAIQAFVDASAAAGLRLRRLLSQNVGTSRIQYGDGPIVDEVGSVSLADTSALGRSVFRVDPLDGGRICLTAALVDDKSE